MAGLLGKSYAADMNDCITNGESGMVSTNTLNLPDTFSDTGVYHVVRAKYNVNDNLFIAQTIYGDDGSVYNRECWNNTWRSWQRIDNFGYNTLAELNAGVASEILPNFKCGIVNGTSSSDYIKIAKDVIDKMSDDCSFSVIHKYSGQRYVHGYIYGSKNFGTVIVQKYEGYTATVDINNGVYTIRS